MTSMLRNLARAMLASVFIRDGLDAILNPASHVEKFRIIEPTLEKAGLPPVLTSDAKLLARISGLVTAVTATALGLGKFPRLSAFLLALFNLPITVINNPLWAAKSESQREKMSRGLILGIALTGGLGLAMLDGTKKSPKTK